MDIVITRPSLPPLIVLQANCQIILNDLVAREQAYVEQNGVVFWRMPPALGLFIIYVTYVPNRRLVERFQLSYNPKNEPNIIIAVFLVRMPVMIPIITTNF